MNRFARERLRVGANEVSSASTMYLDASMRPCLAARRRWTSCSIVAGDTQAKVCLCSLFWRKTGQAMSMVPERARLSNHRIHSEYFLPTAIVDEMVRS